MELLNNLALGFQTALSWNSLLYCFVGVFLGTLIGVLPGLGPVATISLLLPLTMYLDPATALIMLAGIYYGAQYGGSTTAILINLPGESSAVVTTLDGYQMTLKGRAGAALITAAVGSFFAGSVATLLIALFAPPLAKVGLQFGSAEYFALMVLGLVASVTLASGDLLKALAMIMLGLLLGLSGQDMYTGTLRFTFGVPALFDGFDFVAIAMGVFGIGEIIRNLENERGSAPLVHAGQKLRITWDELKRIVKPILRGTAFGSALGVLPGGGAMLSAFAAYSFEKKISRTPGEFGKGAIEGVAAPESANNAGAQMSFVPMLTLGIPSNAVGALMIGALITQGIAPGPNVVNTQPALFWGVIASMWVGNVMLLILNLPLIGLWVKVVSLPYHLLYPAIVIFCCVGAYAITNSPVIIYTLAAFGLLGYVLNKLRCEAAPLLIGFVLGSMLEEHLRRAMLISHGDPAIFVQRPISAGLLFVAVVALGLMMSSSIRKRRETVFEAEA